MLRVTIELLPWGREADKRTIAVGTITNLGTGSPTSGNCFIDLRDAAGCRWKHCTLTGFPRKRLLSWDLLYRALKNLVGGRNSL